MAYPFFLDRVKYISYNENKTKKRRNLMNLEKSLWGLQVDAEAIEFEIKCLDKSFHEIQMLTRNQSNIDIEKAYYAHRKVMTELKTQLLSVNTEIYKIQKKEKKKFLGLF